MRPIACAAAGLYTGAVDIGTTPERAMMRALTVVTVVMGIAILVALALVAYGILRSNGPSAGEGFGTKDLGLAPGCEIAGSTVDDDRLVIRTTGLVEADCHQVFVLDLESGRVIGRITAQPSSP